MKAITPMKRLKGNIDHIIDLSKNYGFSFKQLNKRSAESANYYFSYNGRKAINSDCVYIFHNGSPFSFNPKNKQEHESFGISFDYQSNPDDPKITFSIKRKGAEEPTYSEPLNLSEAKSVLSKLKTTLFILHSEKKIDKDGFFDQIELAFLGAETKQEIKQKIEDNKKQLPAAVKDFLEAEKRYEKSIKKPIDINKKADNKVYKTPEYDEMLLIQKQMQELKEKKRQLERTINKKKKQFLEDLGIEDAKEQQKQEKENFIKSNDALHKISKKAGLSRSDLDCMIETERKRLKVTKNKPKR